MELGTAHFLTVTKGVRHNGSQNTSLQVISFCWTDVSSNFVHSVDSRVVHMCDTGVRTLLWCKKKINKALHNFSVEFGTELDAKTKLTRTNFLSTRL